MDTRRRRKKQLMNGTWKMCAGVTIRKLRRSSIITVRERDEKKKEIRIKIVIKRLPHVSTKYVNDGSMRKERDGLTKYTFLV